MRTLWVTMIVTTMVITVTVVIVSLAVLLEGDEGKKTPTDKGDFEPDGSVLDFFVVDDGLYVKWYHAANSLAELEEALEGDYMMLEGDIVLRWHGFPNQTDEPIMAHPPDVDSDNTLDNWLEQILNRDDKGMKMDFKSLEVVRPSVELLLKRSDDVRHPIWLNADVISGPGSTQPPIDAQGFLDVVNELWPKATLSLGWTTECCEPYTREIIEEMLAITHTISQPVTFPARAGSLHKSWPNFKWLLDQDPERYSLTLWTPAGNMDWEGTNLFDLLHIRNSVDKSLIFYDLPGEKFEEFVQLALTAGSVFHYFPLAHRDGLLVTWAHAVNSQDDLEEALNGDLMMLEADVLLHGAGTENQTDVPIMAHPPDIYSDITLEEWLGRVMQSHSLKGIKLDFKGIDVIEPAMKILEKIKSRLKRPVWLNADIFQGPNSQDPGVNHTEFKRILTRYFPESTWSVGWTTEWNNSPDDEVYTKAMITQMLTYLADVPQPVTFPLRAAMVRRSWPVLSLLLDSSPHHTFTIWSSESDDVDPNDLVFVRLNSDPDRVFYDLPEPLMGDFLDRINFTRPDIW